MPERARSAGTTADCTATSASDADRPPAGSEFSAGMGFYSAVWPLVGPAAGRFPDRPAELLDHARQLRQQGHAARPGRDAARATWKERGPTWSSVFQTVEGGLGYWAGQPLPLRPAEVQPERHAAMLRLRGRLARLVLLLRQRGAAGQPPGHRPAQQPAADPSRCPAVPGQSQRRVPRLHLDGAAVHRAHDRATRRPATRAGPAS
ncbi:MAG: hypothetical protein M0C28_39835 [Candidatus Moduliflexus flocculans]|nr:hypothetical protein [Candidatus Moduliflexus flocculans]